MAHSNATQSPQLPLRQKLGFEEVGGSEGQAQLHNASWFCNQEAILLPLRPHGITKKEKEEGIHCLSGNLL